MKYVVTGCAGFIGSHLVDKLLALGASVVGLDNLSTGKLEFLEVAIKNPKFSFNIVELTESKNLAKFFEGADAVFHFAANADVRFGPDDPLRDLQQNTIATSMVLEAMREAGCKNIYFSSTGSVYGDAQLIPTPENCPFPVQTSFYGASKLACEGLISAYCEAFGFTGTVYRFVSILGERYTHGHVFDFYKQLSTDPSVLNVLGDGTQRKSYLYVRDCIDAITDTLCSGSKAGFEVYNLGTDEYCTVDFSISVITDELKCSPCISYAGGPRGWVGDNPFIFLDTKKIQSTGWKPHVSIASAIRKTVRFLVDNKRLLIDE